MWLPLPPQSQQTIQQSRNQVDNLFLLYYRYVWTWRQQNGTWTLEADRSGTPKKDFLDRVVAAAKRYQAEPGGEAARLLSHALARQRAYLDALKGGPTHAAAWVEATTEARLVAGLGYGSPLEVGSSLHPLYGVPYLPGASVKGLVRAWAEQVEGEPAEVRRRIFGSADKRNEDPRRQRLGTVTFHDAFPVEWPTLEVDVLTPHYGLWYTEGQTPGDWLDPVPTYFLTVAPGNAFCFALTAQKAHEEDLKQARGWLKSALAELGAGGKTAAGYGYFRTGEAEQDQPGAGQEGTTPALASIPERHQAGVIEMVNLPRNYGRVAPEGGGEALRFDFSDANMEGLNKGAPVLFEVAERDGERCAVNVRKR